MQTKWNILTSMFEYKVNNVLAAFSAIFKNDNITDSDEIKKNKTIKDNPLRLNHWCIFLWQVC